MKWASLDDYLDQQGLGSIRERVRRESLVLNGETLALDLFHAAAAAPTIVFIHGIAVYPKIYWPCLDRLRALGYNTVAPARKGHGDSTGRRGDCTMAEAVATARAALEWAQARYPGPLFLMGSSQGGMITIAALADGVQVRAAACHNAYHPDLLPLLYQRVLLRLGRPWLKLLPQERYLDIRRAIDFSRVTDDPELYQLVADEPTVAWRYTLRALTSILTYRPARPYSEIQVPTLFIVGERDNMLPPEYMLQVFRRLNCEKEFVLVPHAGHLLPLEYPEPFLAAVHAWFQKHL